MSDRLPTREAKTLDLYAHHAALTSEQARHLLGYSSDAMSAITRALKARGDLSALESYDGYTRPRYSVRLVITEQGRARLALHLAAKR